MVNGGDFVMADWLFFAVAVFIIVVIGSDNTQSLVGTDTCQEARAIPPDC